MNTGKTKFYAFFFLSLGLSAPTWYLLSGNMRAPLIVNTVSPLPLVFDAPGGFEYWRPADYTYELHLINGKVLRLKNPDLGLIRKGLHHRAFMRKTMLLLSGSRGLYQLFCLEKLGMDLGAEDKVVGGSFRVSLGESHIDYAGEFRCR